MKREDLSHYNAKVLWTWGNQFIGDPVWLTSFAGKVFYFHKSISLDDLYHLESLEFSFKKNRTWVSYTVKKWDFELNLHGKVIGLCPELTDDSHFSFKRDFLLSKRRRILEV